MYCLTPIPVAKGGPLRASRWIPPGHWRFLGIEPRRACHPYRRLTTQPGDLALPAPIDQESLSPPLETSEPRLGISRPHRRRALDERVAV